MRTACARKGKTKMMNLPIATRCGECQFWTQEPSEMYRDIYEGDNDYPPVDTTVGVCLQARHINDAKANYSDQPASGFQGPMTVKDASSFHAALWTKDTHGCLAGVQKGTHDPTLVTPSIESDHRV